MHRIIKRLFFNLYLLRKTNWWEVWKNHKRDSNILVLLYPSFPSNSFNYFFSGALENDLALLNAVANNGQKFSIVLGGKKIYKKENKLIYHNLSKLFSFHPGSQYVDSLLSYQKQLIVNGNEIIPNHHDSYYWENKIYMHQKFKELDISHPATIIVDANHAAPTNPNLDFPLLFKPAHSSGSQGIQKINTLEEYNEIISTSSYKEYLIQEWIDMRRDLRLIYVGDELVLHYWRINETDEWKPTSTGHGSSVDFETLPEKWMDFIFKEYKKLNIKTGAFDVTWRNDDLNIKPIILEVSPSYMPNPAPMGKYKNRPYSEYKKAIWGKDAYYKHYINLVFALKKKLIKEYNGG